jgi:hypothetical protein
MSETETPQLGAATYTVFPDHGVLPPVRIRSKADYLAYYFPSHLIVIIDLDKDSVSVTNDAENVVYDVNKSFHLGNFIADCIVLYRDSMGTWDQLLIDKNGKFAGFESVNRERLVDAVRMVSGNQYDDYKSSFQQFDEYFRKD